MNEVIEVSKVDVYVIAVFVIVLQVTIVCMHWWLIDTMKELRRLKMKRGKVKEQPTKSFFKHFMKEGVIRC